MREKEYLFVGGTHDGLRKVTQGQQHYQLPKRDNPPLVSLRQSEATTSCPMIDLFEVYTLMPFAGRTSTYHIYVVEPLTPDHLIELLIKNYTPMVKPIKELPKPRLRQCSP